MLTVKPWNGYRNITFLKKKKKKNLNALEVVDKITEGAITDHPKSSFIFLIFQFSNKMKDLSDKNVDFPWNVISYRGCFQCCFFRIGF